MELKEEDVVMCTVKNIDGTTVFLHIEGNGEGSMMMSEVAPGRIRNLREYASPNKKIVCKVLKSIHGNIQLSLRRVTAKEREEVEERYKKEKTFLSILKASVKNPLQIAEKIREKYELWDFFDKLKEEPELLDKFVEKNEAIIIAKMVLEKREKEKEAKCIFIIKSYSDKGIGDVKEVLNIPDMEIRYLGSSRFSISTKAGNFKEANHKLEEALGKIEARAKSRKVHFELKEK